MYKALITYLVAINLLGIIVTVADKKKAIKGKALEKAFSSQIPPEVYEELERQMEAAK